MGEPVKVEENTVVISKMALAVGMKGVWEAAWVRVAMMLGREAAAEAVWEIMQLLVEK